ncbi:hypothetical protein AK812_SmicGene11193 [Symbiodinium microadriaticum]|uniref:Uncharacterized protein n=1 Tax=Symbiodinium microadriaticum TaxID=2951 RepID=A0A1Q9EDV8_SYMMI|nr:hypothetical protein AK812_SmicGene11193 [Symbiodinium microadriaticum]
MVPEGLTCKNTFFDVVEEGSETREGPATCPPSSDGWWWPTSSMGSDGSRDRSLPSSPTTPFDLPITDKTAILRTPSWFGDTSPVAQTNFLSTPNWLEDLVPPPSSSQIIPPLSTPDWMDDEMPAYAKLPSFDTRVPSLPRRSATPSSGDGRTPTAEGSTRRTPDPFDDTPSPPLDMQFSNSSSRFVQLLAGAEAEETQSKREAVERQRAISQPMDAPPNPGPGNWARPLIKPPVLLATAAPQNEAPGPTGPYPPFGAGSHMPPPMPVPLPQIPPHGSLLGDPGPGFRAFAPFDEVFGDRLGRSSPDTSESPQQLRKSLGRQVGAQVPKPKEPKSPLPAGPLLPGQVGNSSAKSTVARVTVADGEESSPNRRRKRGSRESKDPDISEDDPHGLLPTAAFVDLGVLLRVT